MAKEGAGAQSGRQGLGTPAAGAAWWKHSHNAAQKPLAGRIRRFQPRCRTRTRRRPPRWGQVTAILPARAVADGRWRAAPSLVLSQIWPHAAPCWGLPPQLAEAPPSAPSAPDSATGCQRWRCSPSSARSAREAAKRFRRRARRCRRCASGGGESSGNAGLRLLEFHTQLPLPPL